MLHLATQVRPDIPVIFVDTGYLFQETYEFAERLAKRLEVNLRVYRSRRSPAWQEAIDGKRWEQGVEGIEAYNQENKVEPMNRALDELNATAWLAGLRRQQSSSREKLTVLALAKGRVKIHPIIDWTDKNVHDYLKANDLPYHPLWEQGYISIGDTHTTRKLEDGMSEEETRFFGLKRECGLHEGTDSISPSDVDTGKHPSDVRSIAGPRSQGGAVESARFGGLVIRPVRQRQKHAGDRTRTATA